MAFRKAAGPTRRPPRRLRSLGQPWRCAKAFHLPPPRGLRPPFFAPTAPQRGQGPRDPLKCRCAPVRPKQTDPTRAAGAPQKNPNPRFCHLTRRPSARRQRWGINLTGDTASPHTKNGERSDDEEDHFGSRRDRSDCRRRHAVHTSPAEAASGCLKAAKAKLPATTRRASPIARSAACTTRQAYRAAAEQGFQEGGRLVLERIVKRDRGGSSPGPSFISSACRLRSRRTTRSRGLPRSRRWPPRMAAKLVDRLDPHDVFRHLVAELALDAQPERRAVRRRSAARRSCRRRGWSAGGRRR